jgi:hypothetical protein
MTWAICRHSFERGRVVSWKMSCSLLDVCMNNAGDRPVFRLFCRHWIQKLKFNKTWKWNSGENKNINPIYQSVLTSYQQGQPCYWECSSYLRWAVWGIPSFPGVPALPCLSHWPCSAPIFQPSHPGPDHVWGKRWQGISHRAIVGLHLLSLLFLVL